jgi:hypothetical protein
MQYLHLDTGRVVRAVSTKYTSRFSEILGFWTLSIVLVLKTNYGKHDVSETGSVSVLR